MQPDVMYTQEASYVHMPNRASSVDFSRFFLGFPAARSATAMSDCAAAAGSNGCLLTGTLRQQTA